jgi:serine/threonine protein kinase/predicted esterase
MGTKCPKCQTENTEDSVFCKKCATRLRSAQEISITRTILKPSDELAISSTFADKYKIIAEIGRGGMGVVYKAEDLKLKRFVAIKLLPSELDSDAEAKGRFIQEAQAAAALSHPNICTIHEVEESEGKTYIAMEYIDGYSLRERTVKSPLSTEEALDVAIQVAQGLVEAHKKGITHRDIKTANIMVDEKGQVKIMDFGLAKVAGGALITKEARPMGTVAYMSPEQARGEEVDQRTDIWALGVVLYEMMSCQFPFRGENEATVLYNIEHKDPLPIRKFKSDVPVEIEKVINRCLKKKPESRYQSAEEALSDLQEYQDFLKAPELGITDFKSFIRVVKKPKVAIPAILTILIVGLIALWYFDRQSKIRWAENVALPEIELLIGDMAFSPNSVEAFELAVKAEKYIPDNPKLIELLTICSGKIDVITTPPGANIYIKEYQKEYQSPENEWEFLGVSPIQKLRLPYQFYSVKIEKEGYEPVQYLAPTFDWSKDGVIPRHIERSLDKKGTVPLGMVRVEGRGDIPAFFIDIYEVTNKQFKEFVESGGYRKREYWKHEFIKDGEVLTWEEAMDEFLDKTGRPGPSLWEAGTYKEGQDPYPVRGISWYEAAAYAEFSKKSLPTISHWGVAASLNSPVQVMINHKFLQFSNFGGEGPKPVGSNNSLIFSGAYDMAGNVREWCWNENQAERCIRGGAWNDVIYMRHNITQSPPFNRSEKNGFRCVRYINEDRIPPQFFQPYMGREERDFYKINPVSDDIFQVYKGQFDYDVQDLNPTIEAREESPDWIRERISFDAAYNRDRVIVYLFLPKNAFPPYQTVIYFPGSEATMINDNEVLLKDNAFKYGFIVKNKRALLVPFCKGTGERIFDGVNRLHLGRETHQYTEYLIQIVKDFKRAMDYLETREDIDSQRVAYFGFSWGGFLGNIIPAVEERLKASIVELGGLRSRRLRPEADEINYVTRVKVPTLMLNGKYDTNVFPLETTVRPMFDLLGVPKEHKRLVVYETDHFIPKTELIKETLNWLDKYLGPVR